VYFLTPGLSYEASVSNTETLSLTASFGFALHGGSDVDTDFGLFPIFEGQFRHYYNFDRRSGKGKR